MQQKYLKIYNLVLSGILFMSLAACHQTEANAVPAEAGGNVSPAVSATPETKKTVSKINPEKVTAKSILGTYEFNDLEEGNGNINRLIIEDPSEQGIKISIFANFIFPNGETTSVFSTTTEGFGDLKRQILTVNLIDDQDKSCKANISFADGAAIVKTSAQCSFKPGLDRSYKKISPKTLIKIDHPEVITRYAEVPYAELSNYVNTYNEAYDSVRLDTGRHFIIKDVPISKVNGTYNGEGYRSMPEWIPLASSTEDEKRSDETTMVVSSELSKRLKAADLETVSAMQMTAVVISIYGFADVSRINYVNKIEGLNSKGEVIWTLNGEEPFAINFYQ